MKILGTFEKIFKLLKYTSILSLLNCVNYQLMASAVEIQEVDKIQFVRHCDSKLIPQLSSTKNRPTKLLAQVNQDPTPEPPQPLEPDSNSLPPHLQQRERNSEDQINIPVQTITVTGITIFTPAQINAITKPLEGKTVTLAELRLAIDDITQLYLERGYITSRAVLVEKSLDDEKIEIQVIEGSVERINVKGTERLEDYVRDRLNLAVDTPLNSADLEDQLRLLRLDPLFENVEASLTAGDSPKVGKSILETRVTEADSWTARFSIDNFSPPSVGSERLGFELNRRSLIKPGDRISASYYPRLETFFETFDLGLEYQIPVNARNGTVTANIDLNRNEVINVIGNESFEGNIEGETERYSVAFRQPIIRNPRQELALSLAFDYQDGQTLLFQEGTPFGQGADEDGVTTTSVFRLGQEYIKREVSGAWAFRSQFNLGVNIFGATDNEAPVPDGQFFSWLGQVQRVQVFNSSNFLVIQGNIQLTPDSLLPSQQFVIGGGQSVRGYRQNVRSGDNGLIFSLEDRLILVKSQAGESIFTLTPFFNLGTVWNKDDNPNELPEQNFIAALGAGFIWQPIESLNLNLDYALPLVDLDDRGGNIQDDGLHFSVDYLFSF